MIFIYNKEHVGDVLMVIVADGGREKRAVERVGQIARVYRQNDGRTLAWNIFDVSKLVTITGCGQVQLTDDAVSQLNEQIKQAGFSEELVNDTRPKFVVGEILALEPHSDSDHLSICQVKVGEQETVQIVAGAPNVRVGLKTIVALPGAMMPNGTLIFPGELRGVASHGMMCSPRELHLPNAPQVRGIIELDDTALVGEAFDAAKHWSQA